MRTFNSKEANTGVILHDLYKTIWPEGPKTMASDVSKAVDIATNPDKRQHAKDGLENLITLPGLAGLYVKEKIQHAKNRLKGLTPEGLDPETGMLVLTAKQKNMLEDLSNEL
jgi:hypothetical protein